MTDAQPTLFPTARAGNDMPQGHTLRPSEPANEGCPTGALSSRPDRRREAASSGRRLRKYDRRTGKLTLQYRILKRLANRGQITSSELNRAGATDWHVQRSAGQRLRDVRSVFGLDLKRTTKDGVTTWSLGMGDRIRAKELVDQAARRAPRKGASRRGR